MLKIRIKSFNELDLDQLYDLLRLRSEVFVVEQNCVYQDIDNKDQKAYHVLAYKNKELVGYTRIFKPGDYFNEASIGRVVVSKKERLHNYGNEIMKISIEFIRVQLHAKTIKLSAQTYLKRFYNNLGFIETGADYLEDDIPHIAMILKL